MKILLLVTSVFDLTGGVHSFNRALIKAFDDLAGRFDLNVTVLSFLDGDARKEQTADYMSSGRIRYRGFKGNKAGFVTAALGEACTAERVVFGHVNFSLLACGMPTSFKSLVVHGIDVWKPLSVFQKLGISQMCQILSVSEYTQSAFVHFNGMPPVRFRFLPNTLDPFYSRKALRISPASELGLPSGRMLLTVTRMARTEEYKKIDLVIQSMPFILRHIPDAFFVVVGNGDDRSRLEKLAQETGVADSVIFAGFVADQLLSSYYQACDLFVLPSTKEGFGIVFLEAMYHAKACVGVTAGGVDEVILDGETGLLAEPSSIESFVECVVRLLGNSQERDAMGHCGKSRLEREFSYEKFRARVETILC